MTNVYVIPIGNEMAQSLAMAVTFFDMWVESKSILIKSGDNNT